LETVYKPSSASIQQPKDPLKNCLFVERILHLDQLIMSAATKEAILSLYKQMKREAIKFPYSYRMYALRRIRDGFKENKNVTDPSQISQLYQAALRDMEIIKRQVVIGSLYKAPELIIEHQFKPGERIIEKQVSSSSSQDAAAASEKI